LRRRALPFTTFPVVDAATEPRPFWWDLLDGAAPDVRDHMLREHAGDRSLVLADAAAEAARARTVPDELLPADWRTLASILADDCIIGSHTVTHRSLTRLDDPDLAEELAASHRALAERLGVEATTIAYPY